MYVRLLLFCAGYPPMYRFIQILNVARMIDNIILVQFVLVSNLHEPYEYIFLVPLWNLGPH